MKTVSKIILQMLLVIAPVCAFAQQQDNTMELRLREALRSTTLQLRAAESERAELQVRQEETAQERDALKKQVSALSKQGERDRAEAAAQIEGLKGLVVTQEEKAAQLASELKKWREAAEQSAELAQARERARDALEIRVAELERTVADRERKNVELVKVAREILDRLEKFGLGDAIKAREPFIGAKRVQIQNLVQDYQDKILDQKYTAAAR
ncbi:phage major capsid protein [Termitidicoccus mucosus]|uniref:Uncharacterized protein n=1 Tax=Termitidicoccus mucosus TaxID=1184151 RepID=A0A178ILJ9_9BACT|nr:hypothetical protein AW736_09755 [Opitutaceae bacterium TSB47]